MLKRIALVVGLIFAGSVAAYAGNTTQAANSNGYQSSSSAIVQNGLKKKRPQPKVNGQTATNNKGEVNNGPGNTRKAPQPEVKGTNTAQHSGATENEEGYNKQSATSPKPADSD